MIITKESFLANVVTSVLVMLSDRCCTPCHGFDGEERAGKCLSPGVLRDVLQWAAKREQGPPQLLFLADSDKPLDSSVVSVLEDMPGQIVTPLLAADRQVSLGIPFSIDQTVVVSNLRQLVRDAEHILGLRHAMYDPPPPAVASQKMMKACWVGITMTTIFRAV